MTQLEKTDAVVEAVRADLLQRSQFGIKKYGTTLEENPAGLRDRLQHAYEECLDQANYLKWAIMQLDTHPMMIEKPQFCTCPVNIKTLINLNMLSPGCRIHGVDNGSNVRGG